MAGSLWRLRERATREGTCRGQLPPALRALVLAYRAEALVQDGQLGDGSGVAIEALDLAMRIGYRRVVEQVRTLRPDGLNRAPTLPAVKELDERLRRNPMEM